MLKLKSSEQVLAVNSSHCTVALLGAVATMTPSRANAYRDALTKDVPFATRNDAVDVCMSMYLVYVRVNAVTNEEEYICGCKGTLFKSTAIY